MVTFPTSAFDTDPGEDVPAGAEDPDEGECVNYYPGMLMDLYDEDADFRERLFALQFFGAGEGIEVPGCS